ncbi:MAG: universal stress protein [Armatimonadota bacterium]|nr:universal stress protein [Armatimonadota bacterium]
MIIHVKGDVIELSGSLRENYWPALKSAVSLQLKRYPNGIVIDGHGLTDIDEVGARTFLEASDYIEAHRARVVVARLPEHIVNQIRQIPGARSQLPLADTIEEARESLAVGAAEAGREGRRKLAVLVPLVGDWHKALEYAVPQAQARKVEIHLLYVLQVPRALPLGVPIPEKEREARETLSEAEQKLKRTGLTIRKLTIRSRAAIEGIAKFVSETEPELLLAAYRKNHLEREHEIYSVISTFLQETKSDVAIFCTEAPEGEREPCQPIILVPIIGAWQEAVEFAATQAAAEKAEVNLLYVLQVPRTQPLDVALPEAERNAREILTKAEQMVRRHGLIVKQYIHRSRILFEGIAKFAIKTKPKLVVLSYLREDMVDENSRYVEIINLCDEAPCDVALVFMSHLSPPTE